MKSESSQNISSSVVISGNLGNLIITSYFLLFKSGDLKNLILTNIILFQTDTTQLIMSVSVTILATSSVKLNTTHRSTLPSDHKTTATTTTIIGILLVISISGI